MLIYMLICVFGIVGKYRVSAEELHNILTGSTDCKVEFSIQDDDMEMVSKDQLVPFVINNKVNKLNELSKFCQGEYYKTIRSKSLIQKYFQYFEHIDQSKRRKRTTDPRTTDPHTIHSNHLQKRSQVKLENETLYNFDALAYEYHEDAVNQNNFTETHHPVSIEPKTDRLMELIKKSLCFDVKKEKILRFYYSREVYEQIWKITQIWLVIYIVLAIPLWCTMGWCCCCFCCKCFKAHETIDNARRYFAANPPGILRDKLGDIFYEPSDKEKETYDKLEHIIKTL